MKIIDMKMLLINITLLLLICNNLYAEIGIRGSSSSDHTGWSSGCTLPIDFVFSGTCVFGTFGLWIIIAIAFGIFNAIFRR